MLTISQGRLGPSATLGDSRNFDPAARYLKDRAKCHLPKNERKRSTGIRLPCKKPRGVQPSTKKQANIIKGRRTARVVQHVPKKADVCSPVSEGHGPAAGLHEPEDTPHHPPEHTSGPRAEKILTSLDKSLPTRSSTGHSAIHPNKHSTYWVPSHPLASLGPPPNEYARLSSPAQWNVQAPVVSDVIVDSTNHLDQRGHERDFDMDYTQNYRLPQSSSAAFDGLPYQYWPSVNPENQLLPANIGLLSPSTSGSEPSVDVWNSSSFDAQQDANREPQMADCQPVRQSLLANSVWTPREIMECAVDASHPFENDHFDSSMEGVCTNSQMVFMTGPENPGAVSSSSEYHRLDASSQMPPQVLPDSHDTQSLTYLDHSNTEPGLSFPGLPKSNPSIQAPASAFTWQHPKTKPLSTSTGSWGPNSPDAVTIKEELGGPVDVSQASKPMLNSNQMTPGHEKGYDDRKAVLSPEQKLVAATPTFTQAELANVADVARRCDPSRIQSHDESHGISTARELKSRKSFAEAARQQTSRTRDVGACVRCKIQRIRCKQNEADPNGPCIDCLRVGHSSSKKVIHHIECLRYKLQEIGLFRTCGLRFTQRWKGAEIRDITGYGPSVTMTIDQGSSVPFTIRVHRFMPDEQLDHDYVLHRPWALADVHETKNMYREFITNNKFTAYRKEIQRLSGEAGHVRLIRNMRTNFGEEPEDHNRLIADIYKMAAQHYEDLRRLDTTPRRDIYAQKLDPRVVSERDFMEAVFELWFALRQPTGTSYIVSVDDKSGSVLAPEAGTLTPKMAVCQLNSIHIAYVLRPVTKILLKVMMVWIAERQQHRWLSIFFASFILMREISFMTRDAYNHSPDPENDGPNFALHIADIQESGNIIQAHWHYFNCSTNPLDLDEDTRGKSPLRRLDSKQFQDIQKVWKDARGLRPRKPPRAEKFKIDDISWCRPLYFAEQLFDPGQEWKPLPTFKG